VFLWQVALYEAYDNRVWPDIFASYSSETVFSFLVAAIQKRWAVVTTPRVTHIVEMDGRSAGFKNELAPISWDHMYKIPHSILDICAAGQPYGLGYQECDQIAMHDPTQFDEKGYCINSDLEDFIKENLFLSKDYLDYDKIYHEFIK